MFKGQNEGSLKRECKKKYLKKTPYEKKNIREIRGKESEKGTKINISL